MNTIATNRANQDAAPWGSRLNQVAARKEGIMPEQQQSTEDEIYAAKKTESEKLLQTLCGQYRESLKRLEVEVRQLKEQPAMKYPDVYAGQHGEMIAQSMLAVRAIEDARMRIGKVLQYAGDGVSIYDKA